MAKKQPKLSKTPVCQKAISNNLFLSLRTNCNSSNSYILNNKPKLRTVFFLNFFIEMIISTHLLSTSLSVNIFLGLRFMMSLSGRSYENEIAGN